jgi:hypothetical protein
LRDTRSTGKVPFCISIFGLSKYPSSEFSLKLGEPRGKGKEEGDAEVREKGEAKARGQRLKARDDRGEGKRERITYYIGASREKKPR